ncbi:MAG: polyprenyl diphosphate synthase [Candidatus Nealsonbacteria bacterium]|nr:polyprenyl diphosphate synthase [Candidatus Nealsonbacteria bacterium]
MTDQLKKIPYHLGIIMDGNRRWAKQKGLPTLEGHFRGYKKIGEVGEWCRKKGIKILTLWTFSTENWHRSQKEVDYLMKLLEMALSKREINKLSKKGIKLRIIGQKERFSEKLQRLIKEAEEATKNNKEATLVLAMSYGGRAEIIEAVQKIINKKNTVGKITEETINENLWTAGLPDPDLILRTGEELRVSGFLTWQSVYAELYFLKKYWPEFSEKDLDIILADYANRERRWGR